MTGVKQSELLVLRLSLEFDNKGVVSKLVVKFENDSVGRERRRGNQHISKLYPGGTAIEKVNFPFSISKSKKSIINTANVIQFPIKLAFASTAHKIQGSTISKPQKAIINTSDSFGAAMIYVMLSRVCSLDQIRILNEFDESKMYPDMKALEELKRLENISLNNHPTKWEDNNIKALRISSLNCRSLLKHYKDIELDSLLLKSDMIALQETWLESNDEREDLAITGYQLHLNSRGRGKGVAIYYKEDIFEHQLDINKENMQLSQFTSKTLDIIVIYRSQQGSHQELIEHLKLMGKRKIPQLIVGDFNFCYLNKTSNLTRHFLEDRQYSQIVKKPTHIEGSLLDQAYMRDTRNLMKIEVETQSKYYTDHKGIALTLER